MRRLRAIAKALFYGIVPWWVYERVCHHPGWTYLEHAAENLRLAKRWATGRERLDDVDFEMGAVRNAATGCNV